MTAPNDTRPKSENSTSRATTANEQTDEQQRAILNLLTQHDGWVVEETITHNLRLPKKTVTDLLYDLQDAGELRLVDAMGYTVVVDADQCLGRAIVEFGARIDEVKHR